MAAKNSPASASDVLKEVVSTKLKQDTLVDPHGRSPDPWVDFRTVEIIELNWDQTYRHTLGKYSRFFIELEDKRFFATRCPACEKVWAPPRPLCPDCLKITEWKELSGGGTVASFSILHYPPKYMPFLSAPYVLAYVKLDGADTMFAHLLQNFGTAADVYIDLPVHVVYNDGPVTHPILLMAFEPDLDG